MRSAFQKKQQEKSDRLLKRIIIALLLLALIAGASAGALLLQGETRRLREEGQKAVTEAEGRLAQARAELKAIDPSSVEGEERQLASEQAIVNEAVARAQELETENETLDADILKAQGELDAAKAQEDNAYYLTVYEAYSQGMKKVEGYIEGN